MSVRTSTIPAFALCLCLVTGCKKEAPVKKTEITKPKNETPARPEPTLPRPLVQSKTAPFPGFDPTKVLPRFQGTWLLYYSSLSFKEARRSPFGRRSVWSVSGNKVKIHDGIKQYNRILHILSPCMLALKVPRSSAFVYRTYTFADNNLYVGGQAGAKQNDKITACDFTRMYVFQSNRCVVHRHSAITGRWVQFAAECRTFKRGRHKLFESRMTTRRNRFRIGIHGNALMGHEFETHPRAGRKFDSLESALAQARAKK